MYLTDPVRGHLSSNVVANMKLRAAISFWNACCQGGCYADNIEAVVDTRPTAQRLVASMRNTHIFPYYLLPLTGPGKVSAFTSIRRKVAHHTSHVPADTAHVHPKVTRVKVCGFIESQF